MRLADRWFRRTDNARRTKGDPAPTYQELEVKIAVLEAQIDALDKRNARLRTRNRSLMESNLRLINDANLLRERLPRLDERDTFDREVKDGWGDSDVGRAWDASSGTTADFHRQALSIADPDPTRPYIPTYVAGEGEQR